MSRFGSARYRAWAMPRRQPWQAYGAAEEEAKPCATMKVEPDVERAIRARKWRVLTLKELAMAVGIWLVAEIATGWWHWFRP